MRERIESLEREVMELQVELRVLRRILYKVLRSIEEVPGEPYMPLWDSRDGQEGQTQMKVMGNWRALQPALQAMEGELANIKDKGSDEALHLAKELESQRRFVQSLGQLLNEDARELIEANIMATHDWRLQRDSSTREDLEIRMEVCMNPDCHATRTRTRFLRNGQGGSEKVARSDPSPMAYCPWDGLDVGAYIVKRWGSGEENIPF